MLQLLVAAIYIRIGADLYFDLFFVPAYLPFSPSLLFFCAPIPSRFRHLFSLRCLIAGASAEAFFFSRPSAGGRVYTHIYIYTPAQSRDEAIL